MARRVKKQSAKRRTTVRTPGMTSTRSKRTVRPRQTVKAACGAGAFLLQFAGLIKDGPRDGSVRVDHYLRKARGL